MSDPTMDAHEPRWDLHQQYLGPMLAVADVEASRRFYKDVLGFEDWFTMTDQNGRIAFCGLKWGNAYIMFDDQTGLDEETIRHRGAGVNFYLRVGDEDIDAYYERVRQHATILRPLEEKFWRERVFVIADPDGYKLHFSKPLAVLSSQELSDRMVRHGT